MDPSYASGPAQKPLLYCTIGARFDQMVLEFGDRPAVVSRHQNIRLTYRELARRVDAFASGLVQLGLEPGDRLAIWGPNSAEWIIVQIAAAKIGLILVNINPAFMADELEFCLRTVECSALVMASGFMDVDYFDVIATLRSGGRRDRLPSLRWLIALDDAAPDGYLTFSQVGALSCNESGRIMKTIGARLQPEEAISIQFTSGTTGRPKGATLSHHNILNNAYFSGLRMRLSEVDRVCVPVLLYHCFGMVLGVLACVSHGACLILSGEAFEASDVLATIEEERCTALHGVPTMFGALLGRLAVESRDLSSLRTGIVSGAPCPADLMRRILDELHMPEATIGYGMTEVSPLTFQSLPGEALSRRVETVGAVHDYVEAKVVAPDGRVVARGVPGEIWFRGYCVMRGYWGDDDRSIEAFGPGGWIRSGDMAIMDADGRLRVTGRLKDIIVHAGEKIVPGEIERLLCSHPAISEAHVFGVASSYGGEDVAAWIKSDDPNLTEAEVAAFCRRRIAAFKVPSHIRLASEFPVTTAGKINTLAMRAALIPLHAREEDLKI